MKSVLPIHNRKGILAAFIAVILTSASVALAQSDCAPAPPGLVAWWQAESNAVDSVGGNNGIIYGGVSFASGKVGNGFAFDGTGFIVIPNSPSLNFSNQLSIELWYMSTQSNSVYYTIIDKRVGATLANYGINNAPINGLGVFYDDPTVMDGDDTPFGSVFEASRYWPAPDPGSFHHLVATYQQLANGYVQLQTFIDGQLVRTRIIEGNLANTLNTSPVTIGAAAQGSGEFFQGIIDEISIYDRALSSWEVLAIYNAGASGKCPAPVVLRQPQTQTIEAGSAVRLQVSADGVPPLSYQWFFNGTTALPSGTNSFLDLADVQASQSGTYVVQITNSFGATNSPSTMLSVIPPVPRSTVSAVYLTGEAGDFLHLDYSDTFPPAVWQPLGTITLTNDPQVYVDLSEPLSSNRFYRTWQTNTPSARPALQATLATEISLAGTIGGHVRVDCINALGPTNAWVTLDTVTLSNTTQLYFDLGMFGQPARLYRLVQLP